MRAVGEPAERERLSPPGASGRRAFTADGYVGGVLEFIDEFERVRRSWA